MSNYKISSLVENRTLNYRMSVDSKKDPEYIKLKEAVKLHNQQQREREDIGLEPHYIQVRGRGRNPKVSGSQNKMFVADSNASYFDVYICRDNEAMHRYSSRKAKKKAITTISAVAQKLKKSFTKADNAVTV